MSSPPRDDGGEPLFIVFNAAENGVDLTLPQWPNVGELDRACSTPPPIRCSPMTSAEPPGAKLIAPPLSILAFAGKP